MKVAVGRGVLVDRGRGVFVGLGFEGGGGTGVQGFPAASVQPLGGGGEVGSGGGGGSHGGAPATPQLGGGTEVHAAPVAGSIQSDWACATRWEEKKASPHASVNASSRIFQFIRDLTISFISATFLKLFKRKESTSEIMGCCTKPTPAQRVPQYRSRI